MTVFGQRADGEARHSGSIDADHLERITLGDRQLEREVLQIFLRQISVMLGRVTEAEPAIAVAAAHTLKGSARGIGAWRVAQAAERLESADGDRSAAIAELEAASAEARTAIDARLEGRST